MLKPFHEEVKSIEKTAVSFIDGNYQKEYLNIRLCDGGFIFPSFDSGKMYTGMELSNKYTLKELGITYKDGENK